MGADCLLGAGISLGVTKMFEHEAEAMVAQRRE